MIPSLVRTLRTASRALAGGAVTLVPSPAHGQGVPPDRVEVVADGDTIPLFGAVGGVAVDRLGYVYVANFRNEVFRYEPGGEITIFAEGLYGTSGNAIGPRGELYQSSFHGNYISRIERDGGITTVADSGLSGPVGLAIGADGQLYAVNCNANNVVEISPEGSVVVLATGHLFACPNGITRDDRGDLYVVNFGNTKIVRVTRDGNASEFADIPGAGGNAHIAFARDGFYVTKFRAHQLYRLDRDGTSRVIAGTGQKGVTNGPAHAASLSQPNGIAATTSGATLWVNELLEGDGVRGGPARSVLRRVSLVDVAQVLRAATDAGQDVGEAYRAYREGRPHDPVLPGAVRVGYELLSARQARTALTIFTLVAEDFPENANAQYQLGEAYRFTNQADRAVRQYRRTLELDPDHALAGTRLASLSGEGG